MNAISTAPRWHAQPARRRSGRTEIVRNGLIAATEEMKTNLMRTAYNMIIYEALDFTVGLFDANGDTVPSASACRCSSGHERHGKGEDRAISAATASSRATFC